MLKRHGALDRFGITLLHNHFALAAGEVLCEATDEGARMQTIRPVPACALGPAIETSWRLTGEGKTLALGVCRINADVLAHIRI